MQFSNLKQKQALLSAINKHAINGNFKEAVHACNTLNKEFPNEAEGWHLASRLALVLNNPNYAIETINRALVLSPSNQHWIIHKVLSLLAAENKEEAINLALDLANSEIADVNVLDELARLLSAEKQYNESKVLFEKALSLNPQNECLKFNLATVHRFLGELEQSVSICDKIIRFNQHHYDAHFLRSNLVKQSEKSNHINELNHVLNDNIKDASGYSKISFSLAKELEDCGQFDLSFDVRSKGAKVYRQQMNYDFNDDIAFINQLIKSYDSSQFIKRDSGSTNDEAIFILGLPRTGTTLVERVISSHSEVYSAGELTVFPQQMSQMMQALTPKQELSRADMVKISTQLDFRQLGTTYIDKTRPETNRAPKFIDKFPQNALYAGLIHKALPKAKIILLERHPMDVCYSVYKQLFTDIYHFSYDLNELAEYFIAHQKLMQHWQNVMPNVIKVVRYEDIVNNLEVEAKELLAYCNLDWQNRCLDFHKNKQASTTASASQVREKLYTSSIGMWRNYEKQLTPLKNKLEQAGCLNDWPV